MSKENRPENTSATIRTAAGDVENNDAEAGNNSHTDGDSNEWYSTNAGNSTNTNDTNAVNDVNRTSARDTTIVNGVDDPTATNKDSRFIYVFS